MDFLGRETEQALLREWTERSPGSWLTAIYGRRRVGKTRLVEETFKGALMVKLEGLEGQPTKVQQRVFLERIAEISGRREHALVATTDWTRILVLLAETLQEAYGDQPVVLLLDEFQWMAAGRTRLVSSLKYAWDNHFRKHNRVHLILCGSVGSFLVRKVLRSKALYGRVGLEIHLQPLRIPEIERLFRPRRSVRDVIELYMALGGIPQYLEMVDPKRSVRANLERLCFSPHGYLVQEFERILISHFGTATRYRVILRTLGRKAQATREELQHACKLETGGRLTRYLEDLELAGFVERYTPVDRPQAQRVQRFRLADSYVRFYFRFIQPARRAILQSTTPARLSHYVSDRKLDAWRGVAFEHLCRQHAGLIAERLGFGGIRYEHGSWFSRNPGGVQIDLVFLRADRVITLCEIKFRDAKVGRGVIAGMERKRAALDNPRGHTIECVLITASPPTAELEREGYFHRILLADELFDLGSGARQPGR